MPKQGKCRYFDCGKAFMLEDGLPAGLEIIPAHEIQEGVECPGALMPPKEGTIKAEAFSFTPANMPSDH